jgi:hypothetical protein
LPVPLRAILYCSPLGRVMVPGLPALAAMKAVLAVALNASSAARTATGAASSNAKTKDKNRIPFPDKGGRGVRRAHCDCFS